VVKSGKAEDVHRVSSGRHGDGASIFTMRGYQGA
jgi:hypothetical protein